MNAAIYLFIFTIGAEFNRYGQRQNNRLKFIWSKLPLNFKGYPLDHPYIVQNVRSSEKT